MSTHYTIESETLTNIANAIRGRTGKTKRLKPSEFPAAIRSLATVKSLECYADTAGDNQGIIADVQNVTHISIYVDDQHWTTTRFTPDQHPYDGEKRAINVKNRVDSLGLTAETTYDIKVICRASGYYDKEFEFQYTKSGSGSSIVNGIGGSGEGETVDNTKIYLMDEVVRTLARDIDPTTHSTFAVDSQIEVGGTYCFEADGIERGSDIVISRDVADATGEYMWDVDGYAYISTEDGGTLHFDSSAGYSKVSVYSYSQFDTWGKMNPSNDVTISLNSSGRVTVSLASNANIYQNKATVYIATADRHRALVQKRQKSLKSGETITYSFSDLLLGSGMTVYARVDVVNGETYDGEKLTFTTEEVTF